MRALPGQQVILAVPEIESQLLGAAIQHKGIMADVLENLSGDSFTDPKHRAVFMALQDFHLEGCEVDATLLFTRLRDKGVGVDAAFISGLLEVIPMAAMARSWRQEIEKKHRARRLVQLADDMARAVKTGENPEWLLEEFSYRLGAEAEANAGPARVAPLSIIDALTTLPERRRFVISGYIPAGVVGLLSGTGSTGKSYLTLMLAVAVASGKAVQPFVPEEPGKVLLVNVEDDATDLAPRLHWTAQRAGLDESERALLSQNLIVLPGRGVVGPLAQLDTAGNPAPSKHYAWLRQQITKHAPALLILDTKSRLYGLEENSNDHGAQWLALIEALVAGLPGLSILIVSHTSKGAAANQDAHALRGASAIADNSRFVLSLTGLTKEESQSLGLSDGGGVKLVHAKSSYAMPRPAVFFQRDEHGVPVVLDRERLSIERLGGALDVLVDLLRRDWPEGTGKRDLERAIDEGRNIRDAVLNEVNLPKSLWLEVVRLGIETSRLVPVDDPNSGGNNPAKLIRAAWHNPVLPPLPTGKFSTVIDWQKNELAS